MLLICSAGGPQAHAMKVPFETPNDPKGTFETSSWPRINQQHRWAW
jgi:hypothetical protein